MADRETTGDETDLAFAEFKAAWTTGDAPAVDLFCESHGPHAARLRQRIDDFLFVANGLQGVGAKPREPVDPPRTIGPYEVIAMLGEGGMGTVYKCRQSEPVRRLAAVKIVKRWEFVPAEQSGNPVKATITIPFSFVLSK